jgi:hypothetical protein
MADKTDKNKAVNTCHGVIGQTSVSSMSRDPPVSSMSHDPPVSSVSHDPPVNRPTNMSSATSTPTTEPCAEVLFDLDTGVAGDLVLHTGQTVYLTGIIDDQWLRGRVGHTEGIFPAAYVRVIVPLH